MNCATLCAFSNQSFPSARLLGICSIPDIPGRSAESSLWWSGPTAGVPTPRSRLLEICHRSRGQALHDLSASGSNFAVQRLSWLRLAWPYVVRRQVPRAVLASSAETSQHIGCVTVNLAFSQVSQSGTSEVSEVSEGCSASLKPFETALSRNRLASPRAMPSRWASGVTSGDSKRSSLQQRWRTACRTGSPES